MPYMDTVYITGSHYYGQGMEPWPVMNYVKSNEGDFPGLEAWSGNGYMVCI